MHTIGPEFRVSIRPVSSDCRQDCELSFELIFPIFGIGTQLPPNIPKKMFWGRSQERCGQDHVTKLVI